MSYEANFKFSVYTNGQNLYCKCQEDPSEMHESSIRSAKAPLWCSVASFTLIGPHNFKNAQHETVAVNFEVYLEMLEKFLGPEMCSLCIRQL
jgi:hypothetical protein